MKGEKSGFELIESVLKYVEEYGWDAFDRLVGNVKVIIKAKEDEET